jgi:DNA-binding beta-propeller fold protein YncE
MTAAASSQNTISVPSEPDALLQVGTDLWVASCSGNAVTEINTNDKQLVQSFNNSGTSNYQFDCPDALAFDGSNLWVANYQGNSLTELNPSTGDLVQVLTGSNILNPAALVVDGSNLWVGNGNPDLQKAVLSEIDISSGVAIHTLTDELTGNGWTISSANCMVSAGDNIWVSSGSALEFNSSSGHYVRTLRGGSPYGFCIARNGGHLWISNGDDRLVLEYSATTGKFIKEIKNVPFAGGALASKGNYLFVVSDNPGDTVREYRVSSGTFVGVLDKSSVGHGEGIKSLAIDGSELWTANYSAGSVSYFQIP